MVTNFSTINYRTQVYRIDMPFWPFAIATITSVIIAVFTVSLQARKAAVNNPVDALKYE